MNSDVFMLVKGTLTIAEAGVDATGQRADKRNKYHSKIAPYTSYVSQINKTQVGNAGAVDIVMPIYNLTECN